MSEQNAGFLQRLNAIDRRWIYLLMGLAVAVPILWGPTFPEKPSPLVKGVFNALQALKPGSRVMISFDYDPASAGELQPMATAVIRMCVERDLQMYCMTLWAPGTPLINKTIDIVGAEYPGKFEYGKNWLNLGYQAGNEAVIKLISTSILKAYPNDARGTPITQLAMMKGLDKIGDFDALVSISAGDPGAQRWIQYAVTDTLTGGRPLVFLAGSTGVQTPQLLPYFPRQMAGVLGAIKGAAEFESMVNEMASDGGSKPTPAAFQEAQRRMSPQLFGHLVMVLLIIAGNVIYFFSRPTGAKA